MRNILLLAVLLFLFSPVFSQTHYWRAEYDSAKSHFKNGRPELTAAWLESFIPEYKVTLKDTSQYFEMIHLLARCYMKTDKSDDAEKLFKEDIGYFNSHPEEISKSTYTASVVYLGYLYYQKREMQLAELYFEEALRTKRVKGEKNSTYLLLLNNLAVINNVQKDYAKADSLYKKTLDIKKEMYGANSNEIASTLTTMGNMYKRMGRYADAEPVYLQVVNIKKQTGGEKHPEYLQAQNNLANLYLIQGRFDKVEPIYNSIFQAAKQIYRPQNLEYTKAMNNLGILYLEMGRFAEADSVFQQVLALREEGLGQNNLDYTESLINLANLYKTMSEYKKSELFYLSALSIYEVIIGEKHETYVSALVNLAGLYRSMGRLTEAEPLYLKALKIYKETVGEHNISYANLLNNIAIYYDLVSQYELSENHYKKALEITKDILGDKHPQYATTLSNMADLYKNTGHFEQAEPLYLEAAKIREATLGEKHSEYAASLNNLASLYESMGINDEAEPLYLHALKIVKELYGVKNPYYAHSLNNLAGLYQSQKKYEEAEKLYRESLAITLEILGEKHPSYTTTLNNLALLQQQMGDFTESEKLYLENIQKTKASVGTKHPNYATSLNNLAGLYEHTGKYDEADKLYTEALLIRKETLGDKHPSYTYTVSSLARLYTAQGKYDIADTLWEKTFKNYLYEIQTFFPLKSEKEKGQFYQLISHEFETFNSYVLLRAPSNPKVLARMYDNQLATKALLLNSTNKLRHTILGSKDTTTIRIFKQWLSEKELLSNIYTLPKDEIRKQNINVDSIEHIANDLEKKLSIRSELFKNTTEHPFFSWQDVQKHLAHDEAALEIIRFTKYKFDSSGVYTDSIYYAGLIVKPGMKGNPEMVLMKDGNKMEGKFLSIYKNSIHYKIEDKDSYDRYWKDIQVKLSGTKKVYLSPDGVYNQINTNTLQNPITKKYIVDEEDIKLVTNTKDLINKKAIARETKQLVLLGNPNYTFESSMPAVSEANSGTDKYNAYLNPLPGTDTEVKKINDAMIHHGWQTKMYVADNATEKNLKMLSSPRVVHIATHGFFVDESAKKKDDRQKKTSENPLLNSGLMLTGASVTLYNKEHNIFNSDQIETKSEDGILTAYEAMNLNLDHTDLVVLSACETGLGQIKNGEGVYGLQRAFIISGAKSIIISLWKVNDEASQKLMTYFYQEWVKTNNKSVAFKKAQLKLKEEFPQPYYWGAFIMVQ